MEKTRRRQLGWKNYRAFIVLVLIVIAASVLFIFAIRFISQANEQYSVSAGSTILDNDYQLITLSSDGYINKDFFDNYVLTVTNTDNTIEKRQLGKNTVAFNDADYKFNLYGKAYLIDRDTNVKKIEKHEEVPKSTPAFYKLEDRKYLMADKKIKSKEIQLDTTGYLIIELDRQGGATLANNKVNLKTINPIILKGTYYDFDVSREKLLIDGVEIDLTSIIGTTNEYKDPEISDQEVQDTPKDTSETPTLLTDTSLEDTKIDSTTYYDNYLKKIKTSFNNLYSSSRQTTKTVDKLSKKTDVAIDLTRWTNLTSVTPYPSHITVNYSVFDPNNEYSQIFLVISEYDNPASAERYALSKEQTAYTIRNLSPDKKYNISYGYTLAKVVDESQIDIISDNVVVVTPNPKMSIKITKITTNRIYYKFYLDDTYTVSSATLQFVNNGIVIAESPFSSDMARDSVYEGSFPYDQLGNIIEIRATNLTYNGGQIDKTIIGTYINK